MELTVELDTKYVKRLILNEIQSKLSDVTLKESDIKVLVKSKQNYRVNEWESGDIQVIYKGEV